MELFEFTKILKDLCDYYERKEPKQGTVELWFEKIKRIPSQPIKWILHKIFDDHDAFPKNVPGALWASYREWQQANPDKVAVIDFFECPDCVDGLIWVKGVHKDHVYGYVFRCAKCKQNHCQQYPMAYREELKENYEVMPKGGWPHVPKRGRNIRELVSSVGVLKKEQPVEEVPF